MQIGIRLHINYMQIQLQNADADSDTEANMRTNKRTNKHTSTATQAQRPSKRSAVDETKLKSVGSSLPSDSITQLRRRSVCCRLQRQRANGCRPISFLEHARPRAAVSGRGLCIRGRGLSIYGRSQFTSVRESESDRWNVGERILDLK